MTRIRTALAAASVTVLAAALLGVPGSPAAATGPEQPAGPGGTWSRLFTDEFSGSSLDTSKWRPNWLGGSDSAITAGANTAEDACMDPANVTVSSGAAHLTLTTQSTSCGGVTEPRRGAMIQTGSDGIDFTPSADCNDECFFEARIRLPATANYVRNWPAFWTNAQATWPTGGENDIMEGLCDACAGSDGEVVSTIHYWDGSTWSEEPASQTPFRDGDWHTYGSSWSETNGEVCWYYDGTLLDCATGAETWSPHYLVLDYTSGTWGGPTAAGHTMDVDYVRVWGAYESLPGNLLSANHESFETSVGNWFAGNGNTTISRQTTQAYTGGASLRLRSGAAGSIYAGLTNILVSPSTQYMVKVWFRTAETSKTARIDLDFYTGSGSGTYISSRSTSNTALTADGWTSITDTFTTPANTGEIELFVGHMSAGAAGQDLFIDSVYLG